MQFNTTELITDLIDKTKNVIEQTIILQKLELSSLNKKQNDESWSILECFEHLNRYGRFYLPEIEHRIDASNRQPNSTFKSGILGNYFANSMKPKEQLNKMKTFTSMNPSGSKLGVEVIDEFLSQQQTLLKLLERSKSKDLDKVKTSISISKFIKLKLGDTLRVVIYHNERHLVQANIISNNL